MKNNKMLRALQTALLIALMYLAPVFAQTQSDILLKDTQYKAVLLKPGSNDGSLTFQVDTPNAIKLLFSSNSDSLVISLQAPDLSVYSLNNIETIGGTYLMIDAAGTNGQFNSMLLISSGVSYIFNIPNPAVGLWTVHVSDSAIQDDVGVFFAFYGNSGVKAAVTTNYSQYNLNDTVVVAAIVNNGDDPFINATVTATIFGPSMSANINLLDNGTGFDAQANDGIYSASVNAAEIGEHKIACKLEGTINGNPFSKDIGTTYIVNEEIAKFTSVFSDMDVDIDGNGFIDEIVIESQISFYKTGEYNLKISLKSDESTKNIQNHKILSIASPVTEVIALSFDSAKLSELGGSGIFQVSEIEIEYLGESMTRTADHLYDAYTTGYYDLGLLQKPAIVLTDDISELVTDNDSDALFDALQVTLNFDLLYGGYYRWSVKLVNKESKEIETLAGGANMDAGLNDVLLTFNGAKIGQGKVNGPFFVKDLLFWGNNQSKVQNEVYQTQFYRYIDFEAAPIRGDLNGDSLVDAIDRNLLRNSLGECTQEAGFLDDADYDGDGCITYNDYKIWYNYYKEFLNH